MTTPTAALAWELWRKNRRHLLIISSIVLFFIILYPWLCALMRFNLASPDATDEFARHLAGDLQPFSLLMMGRVLFLLFLIGGPVVAMVLTLGYVIWMFTFTEVNAKTKDPMAFTAHVFNLPISTPALFWRLVLGGLAAVLGLLAIWIHCVRLPRLPHMEIFTAFDNGWLWATLLVLAQAIVWSLAAWPFLRMLTLIVVCWLVVAGAAEIMPFVPSLFFLPLLIIGVALGRAGMEKMRHGQWQNWAWSWPRQFVQTEMRGPRRFASPLQAQVWFEWRRAGRGLVVPTILLAWVPVIFLLLLRGFFGYDRLSVAGLDGFSA